MRSNGIKLMIVALLVTMQANLAKAQSYEMTFSIGNTSKEKLYIAQHFRDQFVVLDSATRNKNGQFVFKGKRKWEAGIYALIAEDAAYLRHGVLFHILVKIRFQKDESVSLYDLVRALELDKRTLHNDYSERRRKFIGIARSLPVRESIRLFYDNIR